MIRNVSSYMTTRIKTLNRTTYGAAVGYASPPPPTYRCHAFLRVEGSTGPPCCAVKPSCWCWRSSPWPLPSAFFVESFSSSDTEGSGGGPVRGVGGRSRVADLGRRGRDSVLSFQRAPPARRGTPNRCETVGPTAGPTFELAAPPTSSSFLWRVRRPAPWPARRTGRSAPTRSPSWRRLWPLWSGRGADESSP